MERHLGVGGSLQASVAAADHTIGVAALVRPVGPRQREVAPTLGDRLIPLVTERQLARIIERVTWIERVLLDRHLEQIEVLPAALGAVGFVDDEQHVALRILLIDAVGHGILVAGMMPSVAIAGMDFLVVENDADPPVELVAQTGSRALPDALDLFAPTGLQDLVEVQADADVEIGRDGREGGVAREIEPPRLDRDVPNGDIDVVFISGGPQTGDRHIRAAGVGHQDQIGVLGRLDEAIDELFLILRDRVNADFE
jgi:hypothetical protein